MTKNISIGVTAEFTTSKTPVWDAEIYKELSSLPNVHISPLESGVHGVTADDLAAHDIVVVRKTGVPTTAFSDPGTIRTKLITRFGVGYDHIDMEACARSGIAVTITPEGVRRPVASSVVTLVLALGHRLREKDMLVRSGDWNTGRELLGTGHSGRVFASIGFGNIAREAFRLLQPFGMRHIACDPYADIGDARTLGVELVDMDTALSTADFLAVNCPLSPSTRHIINSDSLARMKSTAFLINTARGQLVHQEALVDALSNGRLAGAGLDVFEEEPTTSDNPLFKFQNVIATPHSICWSDECARLTSEGVFQSISEYLGGKSLTYQVNHDVPVQRIA